MGMKLAHAFSRYTQFHATPKDPESEREREREREKENNSSENL
jgi:hypothetical protein